MLNDFLIQGLDDAIDNGLFMKATLTIGTHTLSVARDSAMRMMPFMDGGQDAQATIQCMARASDVIAINASPRLLIGNIATMDGGTWRISDITQGTASIRISMTDANT